MARISAVDGSPLAMAPTTDAASRRPAPLPPRAVATVRPRSPSLARRSKLAKGRVASRSWAAAVAANSALSLAAARTGFATPFIGLDAAVAASFRDQPGGTIALRDQLAGQGDELPAILERILERGEAADQEGGDAELVVVHQGVGHLLARADQRGPGALRAEERGH